jgi:hypothetical protein
MEEEINPKLKFALTLAAGLVLLVLFFWLTTKISGLTGHAVTGSSITNSNQENTDALARCLVDKGAKFYGAYWCPHCQEQKTEFGSSAQYLPYVECDPSGENANPQECQAAGIQGYPTWVINKIKYEGSQSLDKLKDLTGC